MTTTQKLIWAFWIFIIGMLLWEFYDYNTGLDRQAKEHPKQTHFYAYPPGSGPPLAKPAPQRATGVDLQQTAFTVDDNSPSRGNFTCHVTLTNKGLTKATDIQVKVRPFRGVSNYDEDGGNRKIIVLADDDPISKIGDFLSFPDLGPGESSTQSISYVSRADFQPGTNPHPEILFQTDKSSKSASPSKRTSADASP